MKSFNKNSLIALGTGTSTGIPMIGCQCRVCNSLDYRDQRLRSSIYLETALGKKILIDTTPDLRTQLLNNKISAIDFVIITHDHADHLHGIDDLRPLTFGPPLKEIPLYCNKLTKKSIEKRFHYIFKNKNIAKTPIMGGGIPRLSLNIVANQKKVILHDEEFYFFNYPHGHGTTMGFYHAGLAYIVDCMELPDELMKKLKKLKIKLLIIDCLKRGSHTTHLTVDKTFDYIKKINPERAGLIHMGHDLSHQYLAKIAEENFGKNVFPLYDQLKLFY